MKLLKDAHVLLVYGSSAYLLIMIIRCSPAPVTMSPFFDRHSARTSSIRGRGDPVMVSSNLLFSSAPGVYVLILPSSGSFVHQPTFAKPAAATARWYCAVLAIAFLSMSVWCAPHVRRGHAAGAQVFFSTHDADRGFPTA